LYSKLMSARASVRGISLHSFRPRIRLHIKANMGSGTKGWKTRHATGARGIYFAAPKVGRLSFGKARCHHTKPGDHLAAHAE
jgi:hypothetical protein